MYTMFFKAPKDLPRYCQHSKDLLYKKYLDKVQMLHQKWIRMDYRLVMATGLSRPRKSQEGPGTGQDRT